MINNKYVGDSLGGISLEVLDKFLSLIPKGSSILELGSGFSSNYMVDKGYEVYSVEHNIKWVGSFLSVNYFFIPLGVDGFYEHEAFKREVIDNNSFKFLVIDGPPACYIGRETSRWGINDYPEFLKGCEVILVDDTHRPAEKKLAMSIVKLGFSYEVINTVKKEAWLLWKK